MDGRVRSLRDQFVTHNWSELVYFGLYVSNSQLIHDRHLTL